MDLAKKKLTSMRIDEEVLRKAHEIGLNISQFCENALEEAIEALEQRKQRTVPNGGRLTADGGPGEIRTLDLLHVKQMS